METVITQIIARELHIPASSIVPEAPILEGLAADSLDVVCLILSLEEQFGIAISDMEASTLRTVSDLFRIVAEKCRHAWSLRMHT